MQIASSRESQAGITQESLCAYVCVCMHGLITHSLGEVTVLLLVNHPITCSLLFDLFRHVRLNENIMAGCGGCDRVRHRQWLLPLRPNTQIMWKSTTSVADCDCRDKAGGGIKAMDDVGCCWCVCVCEMCWQMGLKVQCVECHSIAV